LTGQGQELAFAVSLLDTGETDVRARGNAAVAAGANHVRTGNELRTSLQGLWRPLVLAALLLLVLESAAFFRRWTP